MNEKETVKEVKINLCEPVGYKSIKCPNCPYGDKERDCFLCRIKR